MDAGLVPDLKDAMSAIIGAGVALAGLLLIFCGFLFAQAALLDQNAAMESRAYIEGFRATARLGMLPFSAALLLAVLALIYWQAPLERRARCPQEALREWNSHYAR
jgi:hypothetical protein